MTKLLLVLDILSSTLNHLSSPLNSLGTSTELSRHSTNSLTVHLYIHTDIYIYIERERGRWTGGLAGLFRALASRVAGNRRRWAVRRRKVMDTWQKIVFRPVRKVMFAVAARVKARKNGAGLLKLHNDIQTCGYKDVQVMWEMLRRTESELTSRRSKQKQRSFWRNFVWHSHEALPHPSP